MEIVEIEEKVQHIGRIKEARRREGRLTILLDIGLKPFGEKIGYKYLKLAWYFYSVDLHSDEVAKVFQRIVSTSEGQKVQIGIQGLREIQEVYRKAYERAKAAELSSADVFAILEASLKLTGEYLPARWLLFCILALYWINNKAFNFSQEEMYIMGRYEEEATKKEDLENLYEEVIKYIENRGMPKQYLLKRLSEEATIYELDFDTSVELGNRLKQIRKELGLTPTEVAKRGGFAKPQVFDVEGKAEPRYRTLVRYLRGLGLKLVAVPKELGETQLKAKVYEIDFETPEELGSNLKRVREELGLTQIEVARRSELTKAQVYKAEGRCEPTYSTLRRYLSGLGLKLLAVPEDTVEKLAEGESFETIQRKIYELDFDDCRTLGKMLKRVREELGLTPREIARRARLHPFQIYDIEKGKHEPRYTTLVKYLRSLGLRLYVGSEKV